MSSPQDAARIVSFAGGEIVGRTRLQKIACLLKMAGMNHGFMFDYHLHGPYSEALSFAAADATALGFLSIEKRQAAWGGDYYIYKSSSINEPSAYAEMAHRAARAGNVELELMVTALFLAENGIRDPWDEVTKRKTEKATEQRIKDAKSLYREIAEVKTPRPLSDLMPAEA